MHVCIHPAAPLNPHYCTVTLARHRDCYAQIFQGGSWQNRLPEVLESQVRGGSVVVRSHPRNWGGQQLLEDVVMTTKVTMWDKVVKVSTAVRGWLVWSNCNRAQCYSRSTTPVHATCASLVTMWMCHYVHQKALLTLCGINWNPQVHNVMQYTGADQHPARHQELPAIFVDRKLNVLATYNGSKPWSNGSLSFLMPGGKGEYFKPTEKWAAYVDDATGYGLGVFSPTAEQLVAYRVGPEGSSARSDCSYMAPIVTAAIKPGMRFSYDYYIAIGRLDQIRRWFAEIALKPSSNNIGHQGIGTGRPKPVGAQALMPEHQSIRPLDMAAFVMEGAAFKDAMSDTDDAAEAGALLEVG